MNEVMPVGFLASHYFDESEQVQSRMKIGSQAYDATVSDTRVAEPSVSYLEVTLAHEGEAEYLRMRRLHETGDVSAIGSVTKRGTRRNRLTVDIAGEMVSQVAGNRLFKREAMQMENASILAFLRLTCVLDFAAE